MPVLGETDAVAAEAAEVHAERPIVVPGHARDEELALAFEEEERRVTPVSEQVFMIADEVEDLVLGETEFAGVLVETPEHCRKIGVLYHFEDSNPSFRSTIIGTAVVKFRIYPACE